MALPEEEALADALIRSDLSSFFARSFEIVNAGQSYQANWHIDVIADHLQKAFQKKHNRLVINIPPRFMKSLCVSVAWPAWLLGCDPHLRIMVASYSQSLSEKHSQDCRLLMQSEWYRRIFPETRIQEGENQKHKFVTTERGCRIATSVGGLTTGEGGDVLIVDDPHNALEVRSPSCRQRVTDWFEQAFMSRLNHPGEGVVVVVMQRLHPQDLCGYLYDKGSSWKVLKLPLQATQKQIFCYQKRRKVYKRGEILHPKRVNSFVLEQIRSEIGASAFLAQYQQHPVNQSDAMVELAWFGRYTPASLPENIRISQSWDTAIKTGIANDYSVCTTWAEAKNGHYLLDVCRVQLAYPALRQKVIRLADQWHPQRILVEDKASGQVLIQDLRRETSLPLFAIIPKQDKVSRMASASVLIESGNVFLPQSAPWLTAYEQEFLEFPSVRHDDQVDSTTQYLNWVHTSKRKEPTVRRI